MDGIGKIIETISTEAGKPKEEIEKLIKEKEQELSGLVSEEGAAYIVGRELGVSLLKEGKRQLKIKNLVSGLRSVDTVGRVARLFEPRTFEKDGKKGRVMNLLLGDETGVVRLSLWNEEIDSIEGGIKEDDVLKVSGGFVKMDNRGNPELRVGKGKMERSKEKVKVPEKEELKQFTVVKRMDIGVLKEGDFAEVRGCMVQLFQRNPFYEVCPECSSRPVKTEEKWECKEHGTITPEFQMVVSGVIDDGTGNIRVVFFRELAERVFGESTKGLRQIAEKETDFTKIFDYFKHMGKEFLVRGRVRLNQFTENLELVVNEIGDVDAKEESEKLLSSLQN
jgi:ssDNA-binding replication factor A large subunit